ncbi:trafficking protein particle complex II-specific subunit 130 homolog isoform X2 [Gossypium arboreum]|uniref:trafficking protein particle complex II-specific subunit 130 homolog isoform X2 n=1 Tax=Gossypium arboreum TaxID=29729 RepID=UPI0022F1C82E|nr:trafficking protein particle complex II-specific subunit 130 homolog isoform X2 [Gossypium arboreum]XP_052878060.1 trafficking protein particle complex II-specific subunit 130 homolog isoform X2 [Gossypium arboreum]
MPHCLFTMLGLTFTMDLHMLDKVMEDLFLHSFHSSYLQVQELDSYSVYAWRRELLKDKMLYEINANSDKWMIAGRKRGHVSLDMKQGSRIVISILCMPLVAGYIHPPHLGLPGIDEVSISCSPAGCHLVCVLPPAPSSSFCVPA